LTGGGYSITPQVTQLELQGLAPVGNDLTVTIGEDGLPGNVVWSLTANAICAGA
jgi:hypothetical protein